MHLTIRHNHPLADARSTGWATSERRRAVADASRRRSNTTHTGSVGGRASVACGAVQGRTDKRPGRSSLVMPLFCAAGNQTKRAIQVWRTSENSRAYHGIDQPLSHSVGANSSVAATRAPRLAASIGYEHGAGGQPAHHHFIHSVLRAHRMRLRRSDTNPASGKRRGARRCHRGRQLRAFDVVSSPLQAVGDKTHFGGRATQTVQQQNADALARRCALGGPRRARLRIGRHRRGALGGIADLACVAEDVHRWSRPHW